MTDKDNSLPCRKLYPLDMLKDRPNDSTALWTLMGFSKSYSRDALICLGLGISTTKITVEVDKARLAENCLRAEQLGFLPFYHYWNHFVDQLGDLRNPDHHLAVAFQNWFKGYTYVYASEPTPWADDQKNLALAVMNFTSPEVLHSRARSIAGAESRTPDVMTKVLGLRTNYMMGKVASQLPGVDYGIPENYETGINVSRALTDFRYMSKLSGENFGLSGVDYGIHKIGGRIEAMLVYLSRMPFLQQRARTVSQLEGKLDTYLIGAVKDFLDTVEVKAEDVDKAWNAAREKIFASFGKEFDVGQLQLLEWLKGGELYKK